MTHGKCPSVTRMQEPWVDGSAQEAIRRRYIETRYRMLPYIYALYLHGGRNAVARRNTDDAAIIPGIPECRKRVRAGPTGAGRIHVGP
ncbi:TIM-barrel domain-containing protein [Gluconacetobacter sacchari]|uniref:TIM-barrel domain-containing protein n=1 Tax=Gluconacetobacter sacchari TaxID=92759 RepID=UPI0039B432C7